MTPRYKLRTLLIVLAILPPLLWIGWTKYEAWQAEQERQKALRERDYRITIWDQPLPPQAPPLSPGELPVVFRDFQPAARGPNAR